MNILSDIIDFLNSIVWSKAMLVFLVGTGIWFSVRLGFFQFSHHGEMWRNIFSRNSSKNGISVFQSFCATMAARIGTGNIVGVAVAIYAGGPGALFWMWIVGITNAALSFVECTLGQLYKTRVDGEYRGSGAFCAERGLGWKVYGKIMSLVLMVGAALFMPAAATFSISDSFLCSWKIPTIITSLFIAVLFAVVVFGGIKRIGNFASYAVPFMTLMYLLIAIAILIVNVDAIPSVFVLIVKSAFNRGAVMGGVQGGLLAAVLQGVQRGTFSSAAGMGESTPAASAAEVGHPISQGMANAAGVFLDTIVVCTATGLMLLLTGSYNTSEAIGGFASSNASLAGLEGSVKYVQEAFRTVIGSVAPSFISVTLFFFSFTCIISYYYEAETATMHLLSDCSQTIKKYAIIILRVLMPLFIFIWGISKSSIAWNAADLALGACTWINVFMLWILFPKVRVLYRDFIVQKKEGKAPLFNPDDTIVSSWRGVDRELWREVYNNHKMSAHLPSNRRKEKK